jgi:hypothetical protein
MLCKSVMYIQSFGTDSVGSTSASPYQRSLCGLYHYFMDGSRICLLLSL